MYQLENTYILVLCDLHTFFLYIFSALSKINQTLIQELEILEKSSKSGKEKKKKNTKTILFFKFLNFLTTYYHS